MCLIWRFCRAENTISYVLSTRAIGSNCSYPARLESFQVLTRKLLHSSIDEAKCLKIGGIDSPYAVVQGDQGGAGKTLGRNGGVSGKAPTFDRLVQDGPGLAETLGTSLWKQDRSVGALRGFGARRMDGEAGSVVGVRWNRAGWQSGRCT